jgi:hypothetical protein
VVDDDEEDDDDYEEEVSSEEETRPPKRVSKSNTKAKPAKTLVEQPNIEIVIHPEEGAYLNCSCELEEETYL